ncbi:MAG: dTDP-4-dehydrorhamnose 3,5-epimerase [Deltaproteobacteria bacterium]|nr:dTDP-4-dehydrorhamnose 3,5-epimerase [Candidatus Tharpella sp.]
MEFLQSDIEGVCLIQPDIFRDQRGFFLETFNQSKYDQDLPYSFVQDNMSFSQRGIVRGLHYQLKQPQGKLVFVITGEIFDVAVDIRRRSPTFGRWVGYNLSEQNQHQLFIPPGFAHGFMVLSETARVYYKCTDLYCHGDEYGLMWNDPKLAIDWPETEVLLSPKDSVLPTLETVAAEDLPA